MSRRQSSGKWPLRRRFNNWALVLLLALPSQVFGLDTVAPLAPGSTRNGASNWKVVNSQVAGVAPASLFAPALSGDGQTANWRIVNVNEAGRKTWAAVGNFLIPGLNGYCSAVLVAPRIVLTANHCLYAVDYTKPDIRGNAGRQLMEAKHFVFVAGVHDNAFADWIPVKEVVAGGWVPGAEDISKDWAIVVLTRPARSDIVPLEFRSYNPDTVIAGWRNKLVVAAYPGASFAFSSVLRFSFNCSMVKSRSTNVLSHDCAAQGGSSGSPILVEDEGELRLIGIHSSRRGADSQSRDGVSINSFLPQLNDAIANTQ